MTSTPESDCCSNSNPIFTETPDGFLLFREDDSVQVFMNHEHAETLNMEDWMVEGMLRHLLAVTPPVKGVSLEVCASK